MLRFLALFGLVLMGLQAGQVVADEAKKDEQADPAAKQPEWQKIGEEAAETGPGDDKADTAKASAETNSGEVVDESAGLNTSRPASAASSEAIDESAGLDTSRAPSAAGGVSIGGNAEDAAEGDAPLAASPESAAAAATTAKPYSYEGADLGLSPDADASVQARAQEIQAQQAADDAKRAELNAWADSRTPEMESTPEGQEKNRQYAAMESQDEAVDRSITEAARNGHMDIYSGAAANFKALTEEQQAALSPEDKIQYQTDAKMAGAYEGFIARNSGYTSLDIADKMADPQFKDGFDSSINLPSDDGEAGHRGTYPTMEPINTGRSQADIRETGGIGNVPGAMPGGKEDAKINSGFGDRDISWSPFHYGRDVKASLGEEVKPSADGVVKAVNYEAEGRVSVVVDHGNGFTSVFRHIEAGSTPPVGTQVDGDETSIGRVALAGTGPHIHYEVWMDGKVVDLNNYDPTAYASRCTAYCDNATATLTAQAETAQQTGGLGTTTQVEFTKAANADVWGDPNQTSLGGVTAAASSPETTGSVPASEVPVPPAQQEQANAQTTLAPTATQRLENGEWPTTKAARVALATQYMREQGYDEAVVKNTVALINRENSKWDIYDKNPGSSAYGLGQYITSTWNGAVAKQPDYDGTNWRSDPQAQLDVLADDVQRRYDAYTDGTIKGCAGLDFDSCNYIYHYVGSPYNPNRPGDRQFAINYTARTEGAGYALYDNAVASLGSNPAAVVASMQTVQSGGLTSGRDPWGVQLASISNSDALVTGSVQTWLSPQVQTVTLPSGEQVAVVDRGNEVTSLYSGSAAAYAQPQWMGGNGGQGAGGYPQASGGGGSAYNPYGGGVAAGSVPTSLAGQPVTVSRAGQPVNMAGTPVGAQVSTLAAATYKKGDKVRGIDMARLGLATPADVAAFCKQPGSSLYLNNKDLGDAICAKS